MTSSWTIAQAWNSSSAARRHDDWSVSLPPAPRNPQ
jgi:hypothetical protein